MTSQGWFCRTDVISQGRRDFSGSVAWMLAKQMFVGSGVFNAHGTDVLGVGSETTLLG